MDWQDLIKARDNFYKKYPYEKDAYKITFEYYGPDAPLEFKRVSDPYFEIQEILNFEDLRIFGRYAKIIKDDWSGNCGPNEEPNCDPIVTDFMEYYLDMFPRVLRSIWTKYIDFENRLNQLTSMKENIKNTSAVSQEIDGVNKKIGIIELWANEYGFIEELKSYVSSKIRIDESDANGIQPETNKYYTYKNDYTYFKIDEKEIYVNSARVRDFIKHCYYMHRDFREFDMGAFIRDFKSKYNKYSPQPKYISRYFYTGTDNRDKYVLLQNTLFIKVRQGWYRLNPNRTNIE